MFAATLTVLGAGSVGAWLVLRPRAEHPAPQATQVTFDGRLAQNPAISPDGKFVAYASDRAGNNNLDIWVQALPNGEPVRLTRDDANEDYPSFSPSGTEIAFSSTRDGGAVYIVPVLGGEPRLLIKRAARPLYSPDGKWVLLLESEHRGLSLLPPQGGKPRPLYFGEEEPVDSPIWSPDSSRVLFVGWLKGMWKMALVDGGFTQFSYQRPAGSPVVHVLAWTRKDQVLFAEHSGDSVNLWKARLSPGDGVVGQFERLTFGSGKVYSAAAANDGTVVFSTASAPTMLWSIALPKGNALSSGDPVPFPRTGAIDFFPSISSTGKMAYISQKADRWNIWVRDLKSGKGTWLASAEGRIPFDVSVVISRDGSRVAYSSCRPARGSCDVFDVPAAGGTVRTLCSDCGQVRAWSPDGGKLALQTFFRDAGGALGSRIEALDIATGKVTVVAQESGRHLYAPDFSPDGRWIAFQDNFRTFTREHLVAAPLTGPLPVERSRWIQLTAGDDLDAQAVWSRDGQTMYFMSNRDGSTCLWALRLHPDTKRPLGGPFAVRHFHANPRYYSRNNYPDFSIAQDQIVISMEHVQSDIWMMKLPEER
jgi:Tol biopolymer transport system component